MATYQTANRRRCRKAKNALTRFCMLFIVIGLILLIAWLLTAIWNAINPPEKEEAYFSPTENIFDNPAPPQNTGTPGASVTPLDTQVGVITSETVAGPAARAEEPQLTPWTAKQIAVPENKVGMVDSAYFADTLFVGDSLTEGIELYLYHNFYNFPDTTRYLWMRGITPMDMLNGTWNATMPYDYTVQKRTGANLQTVPIDDIVAANPGRLYIMLGTNCLTNGQTDEVILKYYEKFIDALQERLPDTQIYIQSMTPVGIEKEQENPEKYSAARIAGINEQLAQLAYRKGICYVDVHSVLVDETDHLIEEWNYDGWHMAPGAYKIWYQYLATHTVAQPDNAYITSAPYQHAVALPEPAPAMPEDTASQPQA